MIELLATIAILGIMASVATLAVRRMASPPPGDLARLAADSLSGVVARARAARVDAPSSDRAVSAALGTDGTIVADSEFHVDRLSGTRLDAR